MTNRPMTEILRRQVPLTLGQDVSVREASHAMAESGVGAVLVTDPAGRLVGIFTGRDAIRVLARGLDAAGTTLGVVMTPSPHSLTPECTAIEALRLMRDGGFRHVPVLRDGVVAGVVSRGDFRGLELDRLDEETGLWERIA